MEPLVIQSQGHFFTGLREHTGPAGVSVYGTHVEWQAPRSVRENLVLVHGGGGQALDMLTTPDGREGWATLFLRDGFAVYTVDRPGMGRSPYHPDIYGDFGPPAAYGSFVASFAGPSAGGLPPHTQWPGSGERDDPALAQFLAWQEPFPGSLSAAHEAMRVAAAGLLDRIGPSVLLTHSLGGAFGWLAASERRHLVRAVVAVEPAGAPFDKHPVLGDFTYGLTAVPVSFGPGLQEAKLGGLPVAIVTSECSGFEPSCAATASFLEQCGAAVTSLRLAELGIHGNGHAMMLERNNAEIAALITDWIGKQL
ncbi:MAG TPA: alpha/beta fold hydrolase [Actinopolymorphaceae bacterium]|jgi:pimeloyl-ACP methyl ester carboxylesterase|nr:alpha/beta fold hydrolase [Actinopolymorphaceae bacterium]